MTSTLITDAPTGERRLLGPAPLTVLPKLKLEALIELVEAAGLTGRGGAGFPTARKLRAIKGRSPIVVANAMEGEPLSRKDAVLLHKSPDLVLDGLQLLAKAIGAQRAILALGDRAPEVAGRRGIEVHRLKDSFIAGQETALVNQLNGKDPIPTDPGTPMFVKGVSGRPTLISNAETMAHLALIARYGADWFRSEGIAEDPGTFLVTLSASSAGLLPNPGVLEVARGTTLSEVLRRGRTDTSRIQGVLIGGYHGVWLPPSALDTPLSTSGLAPYGATPGAGIIHLLDSNSCPLEVSARVAAYLAGQSARQCGPCVNGLPQLASAMRRLSRPGSSPAVVADITNLQRLVTGRGACKHPDGTVRFLASTMRVFEAHVQQHLRGQCHVGHSPAH